MEKTNNTIVVNEFAGFRREMQPVMRNGKPTKRMKEVSVRVYEDMTATGYMLEGHEVFILDKDMEDPEHTYARTYKANGERLTCMCQFGHYGQADHEVAYLYIKATQRLGFFSNGYNGATWRGYGATLKRVNW